MEYEIIEPSETNEESKFKSGVKKTGRFFRKYGGYVALGVMGSTFIALKIAEKRSNSYSEECEDYTEEEYQDYAPVDSISEESEELEETA